MELYVRGRCCMHSRMSRGYIFSPILDWGELAWDTTGGCWYQSLRSMCGSGGTYTYTEGAYHGQVCMVVPGIHLMLLLLATLVISYL